jgi:hypothetical protein
MRLPITVPNPAHAQFIARESSDPAQETRALSETRMRQLLAMVTGDGILELRDRAILKFYVSNGARIETGCNLLVSDFHQDGAVGVSVWEEFGPSQIMTRTLVDFSKRCRLRRRVFGADIPCSVRAQRRRQQERTAL